MTDPTAPPLLESASRGDINLSPVTRGTWAVWQQLARFETLEPGLPTIDLGLADPMMKEVLMSSLVRFLAVITLPLFLLTMAACGEQPEPAAQQEAPSPTVGEHMGEHFSQVKKAQEAVIRGDLEGLKEPAGWLAEHEAAEGLDENHLAGMKELAQAAAAAADLEAAALAVGRMARSCGACHEAQSVQASFAAASPPPEDTGTVPHMVGHMWAADRMYEGLVNPSNAAWLNGAEVLVAAPLHSENLSEDAEKAEAVQAMAERVHEVAGRASQAADWDDAALIYGEFLATCAQCHQTLSKGGPR